MWLKCRGKCLPLEIKPTMTLTFLGTDIQFGKQNENSNGMEEDDDDDDGDDVTTTIVMMIFAFMII